MGDFETGDLSQWPYLGDANGVTVVSSPTFNSASHFAAKAETTNAPDSSTTGDASYVEQNSFALPWENPPADVWHRTQLLLPSGTDGRYPGEWRGFTAGTPGGWNMFMEWHNQSGFGPGSSYFGSVTNGDGSHNLYLRLWGGDEQNPTSRFFSGPPLVKDHWYTVLVRMKWSDIGLPAFGSSAVLDNFNRANTGPPASASWSGPIDGYPGQLKVVSNQAVSSSASGCGSWWNPTQFVTPCEAYVTLPTLPTSGGAYLALYTSTSGTGNGYAVSYASSGLWRLWKITGGVWTFFTNINITHAISAGDSIGIMVGEDGYISAMLKHSGVWTEILNTIDPSAYAGPFFAAVEADNTSPTFEDFGAGTYSFNPAAGHVEWWVDGVKYYDATFPTSWRDTDNSNGGGVGGVLFETGHYRITETPSWTDTVYWDGVRVGPTRASVST